MLLPCELHIIIILDVFLIFIVFSQVNKFLFMQKLQKNRSLESEKPSFARKRMLEAERERAVLAYRQLKAEKYNKSSVT